MTDRDTIKLVVKYLGVATILFGAATALLVALVIWLSRGKGTVDAAAVAIVGLVAQMATGSLAGLSALLVSTRVTPDKGEIEAALAPLALPPAPASLPVTIAGQEDPLEVVETPSGAASGQTMRSSTSDA